MMKTLLKGKGNLAAAILLGAGTSIVNASDLTILNTFISGTPAVAAEVNGNFTAVEAAVDDNNTLIAAMDTGSASIPGGSFKDENIASDQSTECQWAVRFEYSFYRTIAGATSASCDPWATIQLPHGRTLAGLSCTAFDNSATNNIDFNLRRVDLTDGSTDVLFDTPATADSTAVQQVSDTTIRDPANATIDNTQFAYHIQALYSTNDFSALGINGRIYGCSVSYQ